MDRVFSVEEELWGSAVSPKMNRSSSEWAFQRFLLESTSSPADVVKKDDDEEQEVVVEIKDKQAINDNNNNNNNSSTNNNDVNGNMSHTMVGGPSPNVPCDSEEYQAFLKSRLNLACAAVALSRASQVKPQDATTLTETGTKTSNASQMVSQAVQKGSGLDSSKAQDKDGGEPVGIPSLPSIQNKSAVQVRSATSGSSRDLSDDDELDGAETTENMNPADAKRVRRMLSNRESARRSRRRKQAHLSELETQVAQLRVENSSLLKRLTDISQKYSEATVDNRVLKADIETMRAKVKMAEGTVKRVTGLNPMFQVMSDMPSISMPSYDGSPSDTSADAAVPVQDVAQNHFHHPVSNNPSPPNDPRVSNGSVSASSVENVHLNHPPAMASGNKMERTPSMQRVASLEHLQKRIRGGVNSSGEH